MKNLLWIVLFGGVLSGCSLDARLLTSMITAPGSTTPSLEKTATSVLCTDGFYQKPVFVGDGLHLLYGEYTKLDFCGFGIYKSSLATPKSTVNVNGADINAVVPASNAGFYLLGNFEGPRENNPEARLKRINSDGQVDTDFKPFGNRADSMAMGTVQMASGGGRLYLAGDIVSMNNSQGSLVSGQTGSSEWSSQSRFESNVNTAVSDGRGGLYLAVNGTYNQTYKGGVVRVDAQGAEIESFQGIFGGTVHALAYDGSTNILYVGGSSLSAPGIFASSVIAVNGDTGEVIGTWNPVLSPTYTAVTDIEVTSTTVYVSRANSYNSPNAGLYAINKSSGAIVWQKSSTAMSGFYSLAHDGTNLYAVGGFNRINTDNRTYVAVFDANGNLLTGPSSLPNSIVEAVHYSDGYVYIGGLFSAVGGQPRHGIARYRTSDWALDSWNPNPTSSPFFNKISGIISNDDGALFVKGVFNSFGGKSLVNAASISPDSSAAVLDWDAEIRGGSVSVLAPLGNDVFIGGNFFTVGAPAISGIAVLAENSGDVINAPIKVLGGEINAMTLSEDGQTLYIGGHFFEVQGQRRNGLAALNTSDYSLKSWNPMQSAGTSDEVAFLQEHQGIVYIFGVFNEPVGANLQNRTASAAIDQMGNATSWSANISSFYGISDVIKINGILYLIGDLDSFPEVTIHAYDLNNGGFQLIFGQDYDGDAGQDLVVFEGKVYISVRNELILLGNDPSTSPPDDGVIQSVSTASVEKTFSGRIQSMAVSDGALFVASVSLGGPVRNGVALVDFDNLEIMDWMSPFTSKDAGNIFSARKVGSYLYVVGQASSSFDHRLLVVVNMDSGDSRIYHVDGPIRGLESFNDTLYVLGSFEVIDESSRPQLAAFRNGDLLEWQTDMSDVQSIAMIENKLVVAGNFTSVNGSARNCLAAFEASTGDLLAWNPFENLEEMYLQSMVSSAQGIYVSYEALIEGEYTEKFSFANLALQTSDWTPPADLDFGEPWYVHEGRLIYRSRSAKLLVISEATLSPIPVTWEVPEQEIEVGSHRKGLYRFKEDKIDYIDEVTGKVKLRIKEFSSGIAS